MTLDPCQYYKTFNCNICNNIYYSVIILFTDVYFCPSVSVMNVSLLNPRVESLGGPLYGQAQSCSQMLN